MTIAVLLAIGVALILLVYVSFHRPHDNRIWLPDDLKQAKLVMIVGRPDQVYRQSDGQHVPLEYKNRTLQRPYDTDIAQLSLQAWLLRKNGMATAAHGYVTIDSPRSGARTNHQVALLNDEQCEALIQRYLDVISNKTIPKKAFGPKCRSCGHVRICHS
jgi:CRISPR-associated exonuclease Cas4